MSDVDISQGPWKLDGCGAVIHPSTNDVICVVRGEGKAGKDCEDLIVEAPRMFDLLMDVRVLLDELLDFDAIEAGDHHDQAEIQALLVGTFVDRMQNREIARRPEVYPHEEGDVVDPGGEPTFRALPVSGMAPIVDLRADS